MSDSEEDIVPTANEACLPVKQRDNILEEDNITSCAEEAVLANDQDSREENENESDLAKSQEEEEDRNEPEQMTRVYIHAAYEHYSDSTTDDDSDHRQRISPLTASGTDSPDEENIPAQVNAQPYGENWTERREDITGPASPKSKERETSESDTRTSATSETSNRSKAIKRKKRRVPLWFKKKRKRLRKVLTRRELDTDAASSVGVPSCCGSEDTSASVSDNAGKKGIKETPDARGSQQRVRDFAVPSPSLSDSSNIRPAVPVPEPRVAPSEDSVQYLCQCRKEPHIFVSGRKKTGELYCQALDSMNNKIIGCCNPIPSVDVPLFRASQKTCYQMLCNIHQQRLFRHNSCPICGLFCTKGRFFMCKSMHHFHKMCSVPNEKGLITCPHCGDDTPPKSVIIIMNAPKEPILLPQQKTPRTVKAAKISIARGVQQILEDDRDPDFNFPPVPFAFSQSHGADDPDDGNMLAHLLSIAFRSLPEMSGNASTRRCNYKNMYTALESGDVQKLMRMFASGLNPNHKFEDQSNRNALHIAAGRGHATMVHVLLQAQTQINALDNEQQTPLTLAIVNKHNDIVKYLIKSGADLLIKSEDGMSPLHIAAKCGNIGACYHLLNATSIPPKFIDTPDDGGWTPLVWAAEFNHIEVVRFLLSKGADPLVKDSEQNIAMHWAAFGGSIDIVELFLNDGIDINVVNVHGDTALHIAARQDKYTCVLLLLARGAKSCVKNNAGEYARDCSESPQSEIYKVITLNMEIHNLLGRFNKRTPRILSNDISSGKERNQIQCVNGLDNEPRPSDFLYVTQNCFTSNIAVDRLITSLKACQCTDGCNTPRCGCGNINIRYDNQGRLLPDFNYPEPPIIFECNETCRCNRITCRNRVVQNGINCRFQLFKTETKGWGIKTLNAIPKGTFVCEYVGEIITDSEADRREDDSYLFDLDNKDGETYCIDARHYGNFARFINHMCTPNLRPVHVFTDHQDTRFPRIAFFANRDIAADEELGYNYGDKFWIIKCKSFTCVCGSEKCMYSAEAIEKTLANFENRGQDAS